LKNDSATVITVRTRNRWRASCDLCEWV